MNLKINLYIKILIMLILPYLIYAKDFYSYEYNIILKQYTKSSKFKNISYIGIDYKNQRVKTLISKVVNQIQNFDLQQLNTRQEKLAFYINLYNIYVIYIITQNYPLTSIMDLGKNIFDKKIVNIKNYTYSLNEIEHTIIRKNFHEPRIHFALVCGAISCPDIRTELYTGKKLNYQLENQTKIFLSLNKGLYIENNVLHLSSLFNWYKEDFGNSNSHILKFIKRYRNIKNIEEIKFIPYYWDLNIIR
ncbi:MAG: hypothetical protein KatS3mg129_3092 [Leptospiraceae bacterium]|nr:MAG: hypothetical protein KatS3mg129_3092 [Leptospiraceae bacterium]